MRQLHDMFRYRNWWVTVKSTEVKHVPIVRQLFDVLRKGAIEVGREYDVVLNYQHAVSFVLISILNHREVALQTRVRTRKIVPTGGNVDGQSVERAKPCDIRYPMVCKPRLHSSPTIAAPFQVNADLVGENFVQIPIDHSFAISGDFVRQQVFSRR